MKEWEKQTDVENNTSKERKGVGKEEEHKTMERRIKQEIGWRGGRGKNMRRKE